MSPNLEHSDAHEDRIPLSNDLDVSVDTSDLEQLMDVVMGESRSDQADHMEVDEDDEGEVSRSPGSVEYFPGAAEVLAPGETFLDRFELDPYSAQRNLNVYYPFASTADWDIAKFLLQSPMSMAQIDQFLKIELIRGLPLSFRTAKELRGHAELLPSGPRWNVRVVPTSHPTKSAVRLYFRDTLECIESLFNHPYFIDKLHLTPHRIFETAERRVRMYSEWMTGDVAWNMQSQLPLGATLLGVVLSSDKTNITAMTGGRVAHPLLISLANIKMDVRNKASNNAFLLAALLPIAEFIHPIPRMCSVLSDRLIHHCLDVILEPLKQAARLRTDDVRSAGIFVSYIVDTPEAAMLACVRGLTSPVTMAMYKNFGDPFRHPSRLGSVTLAQLATIRAAESEVDAYFTACEEYRLSGVALPFWRDWSLSEPSRFLTPEALHHWHCMCGWPAPFQDWCFEAETSYWDGLNATCRNTLLHSLLVPMVLHRPSSEPFAHLWTSGISHRHLSSPIQSVRDLELLQEFHDNKHAIISSGGRCGKKNNVLDNCGPRTQPNMLISQLIKDPGEATNNHNYDPQICRFLDRAEKCRLFDDAVRLSLTASASHTRDHSEDNVDVNNDNDNDNDNDNNGSVELPEIHPASVLSDFMVARKLDPLAHSSVALSQSISTMTHPFDRISVDGAAEQFSLPDLRGALADYFYNEGTTGHFHTLSQQRRAPADARLPFEDMQLWYKVWIQQKVFNDPSAVRPAISINAMPPGGNWKYGRYDVAIFTVDDSQHWPRSGLNGHILAEVRLVMRPIPPRGTHPAWHDQCLVYIQRLDVQAQAGSAVVEPITQMHILKRATRSSGSPFGSALPLNQLRSFAHIVPKFGRSADSRLNCFNSSHFSDLFYLNKYFDKDFYYALYEASRYMEFPQNGFWVVLVMLDRANSQVHLVTLLMASKRKQLEEEDGGRGGVEIQPPLRRSGRHGAGSGGHAAQLSSIGRALESPKKAKKRGKLEVPASEPLNALAPGPKPKTRGNGATTRSRAKQKSRAVDEDPQSSPQCSNGDVTGPGTNCEPPPALLPMLHQSGPGDQFGLQLKGAAPPTFIGTDSVHQYQEMVERIKAGSSNSTSQKSGLLAHGRRRSRLFTFANLDQNGGQQRQAGTSGSGAVPGLQPYQGDGKSLFPDLRSTTPQLFQFGDRAYSPLWPQFNKRAVTQAGKQGGPSVIPPCGTANHRYHSVIPNKHQASHRATSKYLYNGSDSQSMQGIQHTSTLLQAPKLKQVNESMSSEAPQSFDIEEQDFSFINDESGESSTNNIVKIHGYSWFQAFSGIDQDQDETYGRVCSDADSWHTEGDGDYHSYGDGPSSRNDNQGCTDNYTYEDEGRDEGQDGHMKLLDPGSDSYDEEEERRRLETLNDAAIERGKRCIRQHYRHGEKKNISGNTPVVHSDIDIHPSDGQDTMDFESLYRYQSVDFRGEHPDPSRHRINTNYDLLQRHHAKNRAPCAPSETFLNDVRQNRHYGKKKGSQHRAELLALTKDDYENNGDTSQDDDTPLPAPKRRTRTVKENTDDPTLSSFYPRLWRAVLDYAKGLFRLYQVTEDPFPDANQAVTGICRELLDEAMMHFKDQKRQIEDGYWPEYQDSMARVVHALTPTK
ncbi:hypothetical protein BU15DRAFT_62863 [Melanogaster broomeanus]|nr:hypothetical protein BU15DRAFT_62863 [Melanogaster broomeanus]